MINPGPDPRFFHRFAAGAIYCEDPESQGKPKFLGSCGAYTRREIFLTAGHCIPSDDRPTIVAIEGGEPPRQVIGVAIHPVFDIGLIRTEPRAPGYDAYDSYYYTDLFHPVGDGIEFTCYGYLNEGNPEQQPPGRLIRGSFQRDMIANTDNKQYFAKEMSCPAPTGLSGSIVVSPDQPDRAMAVVTGNVESDILTYRIIEQNRAGNVMTESISRIVSYGTAAAITYDVDDWLPDALTSILSLAS